MKPARPTPTKSRLRLSFLLPLIGFLILAGFASVALFSTLSGTRNTGQLPSVLIGKKVPATPVPLLDDVGQSLDLAGFAGQPVLVNFFASWCAPCRAEAPALALLAERVPVIGIAYKDKPADTSAFLEQYGNPFAAIGVDRDGQLGFAWGVYGVPESYVIAADGTVLVRHAGPIDRRVLETKLLPALESAK
ncbi:MAG: DsbE family thiol:disulfide interchange protein [Alphaproteobacteria bacterium]